MKGRWLFTGLGNMNKYFTIKDRCRQELVKYLDQACSKIYLSENARILDIGCGTGVPTMWLANHFPGTITAIDKDAVAIRCLQQKITREKLQNSIEARNVSFFGFDFEPEGYDLILAEGFLNVIGFEEGLNIILKHLKSSGYLVIHDEYKDHEKKCDFMKASQCEIIDIIQLDEQVWWNDYYRLIEEETGKLTEKHEKEMFRSDLEEIRLYKVNPQLFQSVYYVARKYS